MKAQQENWRTATAPNTLFLTSDFRVLDPKNFCGEIIIERDRMKAIETACRAHRMVSTSTDITLPIFADGSRRGANGAYAVPFKHYAPGTEDHGRKVSAGWPVFHQTTNGCELLAIKQAIKVAIIELTTLERQLPPETKAKVQVQIFDDGMFPLEHLSGIKDTMPNESDHISSVYRWSQRFRERFAGRNSPLEVKLQLLWVPGHVDKVKLHRKADEVAGKVSEITMPLLTVGGEERPCRHWNSQAQPRVAGEEGIEGHDDDYEPRLDKDFEENGVENQWQQGAPNDYDIHSGESNLLSQAHHKGQEISMEQWACQCRDIQLWNQLSAEFQECYQKWYALFLQHLQEGDADQEMGGI
ncbi:hypothetical protein B0H65DRAFT_559252 [Neurospora tetraspora]|uniref:RNase H type-1 domain-containing protein n=1 Tax=Neurospora tetraspora TaxID=94610 RepID=A0AAE0MRN8_9PEZI|nr:hypothetical protein B0H65DRAFT_559252 [Neurospora tetraspora]